MSSVLTSISRRARHPSAPTTTNRAFERSLSAGIGLLHLLIMIFSSLDLFIVMLHISLSNRKQQIDDICKQGTVAMLDSWSATTPRRKRRTRRRITSLILSPRRVRTSQSELKHCKNATSEFAPNLSIDSIQHKLSNFVLVRNKSSQGRKGTMYSRL